MTTDPAVSTWLRIKVRVVDLAADLMIEALSTAADIQRKWSKR